MDDELNLFPSVFVEHQPKSYYVLKSELDTQDCWQGSITMDLVKNKETICITMWGDVQLIVEVNNTPEGCDYVTSQTIQHLYKIIYWLSVDKLQAN